jgi:predicted  nucleic acid-binding Zn-ribbon protein
MFTQSLQALKNLEREFMQLLRDLRKKIETLEKEKAGLLAEIESLKEKGEAKAQKLENEVTMLRKEVEALETLFDTKGKRESMKPENQDFSQT